MRNTAILALILAACSGGTSAPAPRSTVEVEPNDFPGIANVLQLPASITGHASAVDTDVFETFVTDGEFDLTLSVTGGPLRLLANTPRHPLLTTLHVISTDSARTVRLRASGWLLLAIVSSGPEGDYTLSMRRAGK